MRCIRLDLEYDGTRYHGWQVQPNAVTIQESLEGVITRITGQSVRVFGAGRTDVGVHAMGQVAHFFTDSRLDTARLHVAMNSLLPGDIAVVAVSEMPETFHARKCAIRKRYEYWIWNDRFPSVFSRRFIWDFGRPLDVDAMRLASRSFMGKRDFSCLQAAGSPEGSNPIRTINRVDVEDASMGLIRIGVEADGFLRHMVRTLVGTLTEVGVGRKSAEDMEELLDSRDRRRAGPTAPGKGLFLRWVLYPEVYLGQGNGRGEACRRPHPFDKILQTS